jgi:hypothetical protein
MRVYEQLLGRLEETRANPTLEGLVQLGHDIDGASSVLTPAEYLDLVRAFSEIVSSAPLGDLPRQIELLVDHILGALRQGGDGPLTERLQLLRLMPMPAASPPGLERVWTARRQEAAARWLELSKEAQLRVDPSFDPADQPSLSVTPPTGGRPGTAPAEIADADQRRAYEQALEANTEKLRRYTDQVQARRDQEQLDRQLPVFLTEAYSLGPDAGSELREVLREVGAPPSLSDSVTDAVRRRREQLA